MITRSQLIFAALLGTATLSAQAAVCTPEEALKRAEVAAVTINRIADGNPEKAAQLHEQLKALPAREPTRSDHGACEAYDRIIEELELHDASSH